MTEAERFRRAAAIFLEVCPHPPDERAARIAEACGGDHSLRAEVESLLAYDSAEPRPSFFERPTHVQGAQGESAGPPRELGGFRIVQRIGGGGMGVVFEAEQPSLGRRVALKIIKPGLASKSLLRRFQHEAQVLARLQHPGIAQIYEAGTFDVGSGPQPYFAMELIHGATLMTYADQQGLGMRARLELMARICDAVQYAHQQGVIHRDLKPANVVVDQSGQPKVLDFGVARVTDADVQSTTLETDVGQLIGTLRYMSPEQAGGDPEAIDTRSDIYALGVVCYELLAGRPPYDLSRRMVHEAVRVIQEEEPSRLSSVDRAYRGDVETIVGKALAKEKTRRYASASDMGADLRRHLDDEPIIARRPTTWYQIAKFAKRNRVLVGGVAAVLIALVIGIIATSVAAHLAIDQRDRAQKAERRSDARLEIVRRLNYCDNIAAAAEAIDERRGARASRILDRCDGPLRGWEWPYLAIQSQPAISSFEIDHQPLNVAFSADRSRAYVATETAISVWDIRDVLAPHRICLLPLDDGRSHVLGFRTFTGEAVIWRGEALALWRLDAPPSSLAAGEVTERSFGLPIGGVPIAVGLDDIGTIAVATDSGIAIIDQFVSNERVADDLGAAVTALTIDPARPRLAVGTADGHVSILDTSDRATPARPRVSLGSHPTCLTYDQHAERLAVGLMNGRVFLLRAGTGSKTPLRVASTAPVVDVSFLDDDHLLAVWADGIIARWYLPENGNSWEGANLDPERMLHLLIEEVSAARLSHDGALLMTAGSDRTVRLLDPRLSSGYARKDVPLDDAMDVADTRDQGRFATMLPENVLLRAMAVDAAKTRAVALCGVAGSDSEKERSIFSIDRETKRIVKIAEPVARAATAIAVSADGRRCAVGTAQGQVYLWEVDVDRKLLELVPPGHADAPTAPITALKFDSSDTRLTAVNEHAVHVWDVRSEAERWTKITRELEESHSQAMEAELLVDILFGQLVASSDAQAIIASAADFSPEVIAAAQDIAAEHARYRAAKPPTKLSALTARSLNERAWKVVKSSDGSPAAYRRALWDAQYACLLAPAATANLNTLGAAYLRVGEYEAAIGVLERTIALGGSRPASDRALLAMARHAIDDPRATDDLGRAIDALDGRREGSEPALVAEARRRLLGKPSLGPRSYLAARFAEHRDLQAIIAAIDEDPELSERIRRPARRLAPVYVAGLEHPSLGLVSENASVLTQLAWSVARETERRAVDYQLAARMATRAVELEPTNADALMTLGVARYRVAEYERAAEVLRRAAERRRAASEKEHLIDGTFLAMALFAAGREEEGRDEMRRVGLLIESGDYAGDRGAFDGEARRLIKVY